MLKEILVGQARNAIPHYREFEAEARKDGARCVEAEHMLLALAAGDTAAGRLLVEAGLDHDRLAAALRDERRQSLAYAGAELAAAAFLSAALPDRAISLGTSAKEAFRRAVHVHQKGSARRLRIDGLALLIGVLQAELGTVPRALALAGIDRGAMVARARAAAGRTEQPC